MVNAMELNTKRLTLRPWKESDAEALYMYAKDPRVGPKAGWAPHKSVEESLSIIKHLLQGKECSKRGGGVSSAAGLQRTAQRYDAGEVTGDF